MPKTYETILEQAQQLSPAERKRLVAAINALDLPIIEPENDLMELFGLFRGAWDGMDATEYIRKIRDEEWD